jgi:hypothetical protein
MVFTAAGIILPCIFISHPANLRATRKNAFQARLKLRDLAVMASAKSTDQAK